MRSLPSGAHLDVLGIEALHSSVALLLALLASVIFGPCFSVLGFSVLLSSNPSVEAAF